MTIQVRFYEREGRVYGLFDEHLNFMEMEADSMQELQEIGERLFREKFGEALSRRAVIKYNRMRDPDPAQ